MRKMLLYSRKNRLGFTLIELLVVISIIALLVAILMPSLNRARMSAQAAVCMSNLKSVGTAMTLYITDYDYYPASYFYPYNNQGGYNMTHQDSGHPHGYLHWSWFLLGEKGAEPDAFECPGMRSRGAPRTNPGGKSEDWEQDQVDQNGQTTASVNSLFDLQAPRIAYTANAAIVPRNKFTSDLSGGQRINRLVRSSSIDHPAQTILVTEFNKNWKAIGIRQGGFILSKSHRPLTPFTHVGAGYVGNACYQAPPSTTGWVCGDPWSENYGIKPVKEVNKASDLLNGGAGHPLNAVGRHHPGGQENDLGGAANFLYVDGHVLRKTVLETVKKREWGSRFYSITGVNKVRYFKQ